MSVIDVRITLSGNNFSPSPDPATLSKQAGDTIKWHNDTAQDITISFGADSPFPSNKNPYTIAAGKQQDSGSIDVSPDTTWKYTISSGTIVTDPNVIIEP